MRAIEAVEKSGLTRVFLADGLAALGELAGVGVTFGQGTQVDEQCGAPVFLGWPLPTAVGLGDVLMLSLWTLSSLKAYGRAAAWFAAGTALTLTSGVALAVRTGLLTDLFPVMLAAGPLMALQYVVWRRVRGPERTTATYRGLSTADAGTPTADMVAVRLESG